MLVVLLFETLKYFLALYDLNLIRATHLKHVINVLIYQQFISMVYFSPTPDIFFFVLCLDLCFHVILFFLMVKW